MKNYFHPLALVIVLVAIHLSSFASDFNPADFSDESNGTNWLTHGRTHSEQRYSPLAQINADNVANLGLAWSVDLPDARQLVATTLAIDGVLYSTGSFSVVTAIDARTKKILWTYDPKVVEHAGDTLRVLWGTSRGVGYWSGKIYIGAGDGRLIAVDAKPAKKFGAP
ncbi:MAG: PQQ-dependent dehydrogenase, methanol/ethanol family, partial [Gammaproteobacteria bacterium]